MFSGQKLFSFMPKLALASLGFGTFCFSSFEAHAQLLRNLQVSGVADIVRVHSLDDNAVDQNRTVVRAFEISVFGSTDQLIDATYTLAGHNEGGSFEIETHEAFVASSKLIPLSRFRLGKFFLAVGRLNQFHQHDWPFISAPKVQREFFNPGRSPIEAEGAADTGLEYSVLLPLPFYLDFTMGITNGYCYGHCHDAGRKPKSPLLYIHPVTFWSLGGGNGLQLGASYLTRTDFASDQMVLTGLDVTYKYREGQRLNWLVQGEVWHRAINRPSGGNQSAMGSYVFTQYGLDAQWAVGVRFDTYSQLNRKFNSTGGRQADLDYAIVPQITFKQSEFSTFRLAYSHEVDTTQGDPDVRDRRLEAQFTFILGAHPAHDF